MVKCHSHIQVYKEADVPSHVYIPETEMLFRLPRLTPGYIRYLQTQAMQTISSRAGDVVMPRLAVLLGALGIGMSGYSSHQLALHHQPSTRVRQWVERTMPSSYQAATTMTTQHLNLSQHSSTP